MAVEILTFEQALEKSNGTKRNLVLGNGFSIGCDPRIFHYESLYLQAEEVISKEMPEVVALFKKLQVWDFEQVIRILENGAVLLPIYFPNQADIASKLLKHSERLKNILIDTIANNHPHKPTSVPLSKFSYCRRFLAHFLNEENDGRVYTFNYDLLLYWALMNTEADGAQKLELNKNDGFGKDDWDSEYITWQNEDHSKDQRVFYLHGALHLFDTGVDLEKYTWSNRGITLIEQARAALNDNRFPLFVAEGKSEHKLNKIKHHPYLHHSYKSFLAITKQKNQSLFIFGHSFSDNDLHFIKKIEKGTIGKVFISIYGSPDDPGNLKIISRGLSLKNSRSEKFPLSVDFYRAETAQVWEPYESK